MHRKINTIAWTIKGNTRFVPKGTAPHDIILSIHFDLVSINLQADLPNFTEV